MEEAESSFKNFDDLYRYLAGQPALQYMFRKDLDVETQRKSHVKPGPDFSSDFARAVTPAAFARIIHRAAEATGLQRHSNESIQAFVRRALQGKSFAVLGSRYGLLEKTLKLFGADAYGVDVDALAVRIAKQRRVNVKLASADVLDRVFRNKKPDFMVSWNFLDAPYWSDPRRQKQVEQIVLAMRRHSMPDTVHLHQTLFAPVELPGFNVLDFEHSSIGHFLEMKAEPMRRLRPV